MMVNKVRLARNLKLARIANGLTQAKVAKEIEVTRTAVVKLEAAERNVSIDELTKLAQLYGRTIESFI